MPLPENFYDEDVNYRIRLCLLVEDARYIIEGSKIHACDGCDALIWVSDVQVPPDIPGISEVAGDVNLCKNCSAEVIAKAQENAVDIGNLSAMHPDLRDAIKKYFGMQ